MAPHNIARLELEKGIESSHQKITGKKIEINPKYISFINNQKNI